MVMLTERVVSKELVHKMNEAWAAYYDNNIQGTCKMLHEIANVCDEWEMTLPDGHEDLTVLCMIQDTLKLAKREQYASVS